MFQAAPYAAFPPEVRKNYEILSITRLDLHHLRQAGKSRLIEPLLVAAAIRPRASLGPSMSTLQSVDLFARLSTTMAILALLALGAPVAPGSMAFRCVCGSMISLASPFCVRNCTLSGLFSTARRGVDICHWQGSIAGGYARIS